MVQFPLLEFAIVGFVGAVLSTYTSAVLCGHVVVFPALSLIVYDAIVAVLVLVVYVCDPPVYPALHPDNVSLHPHVIVLFPLVHVVESPLFVHVGVDLSTYTFAVLWAHVVVLDRKSVGRERVC